MIIKKFSQLTESELNLLIDIHYNHWVKFNPKMQKENTMLSITRTGGRRLP